jgi:hypothetical protein
MLNTDLAETKQYLLHLQEVTLPTFIYSCKSYESQLNRVCLVTGELSSHQVPSPSNTAAVGVKCLEEVYSSLVEGILTQ